VSCCVALVGTARRDTLVATSATRTTRVHGRRHSVAGVDMSTALFPEVVPETDANSEHKRLNFYTRALCCFFVVHRVVTGTAWQAWHAFHDVLDMTRSLRVVSRRDALTQQVEFGFWLYCVTHQAVESISFSFFMMFGMFYSLDSRSDRRVVLGWALSLSEGLDQLLVVGLLPIAKLTTTL